MLSAMTERAEFPVHKNRTLSGLVLLVLFMGISSLDTFVLIGLGLAPLSRAAIGQRGVDQRRAEMRLSAAAILEQERQELAGAFLIDRVDDRAALFARGDELCAGEDGEVGGHGVARHVELARAVARRQAGR